MTAMFMAYKAGDREREVQETNAKQTQIAKLPLCVLLIKGEHARDLTEEGDWLPLSSPWSPKRLKAAMFMAYKVGDWEPESKMINAKKTQIANLPLSVLLQLRHVRPPGQSSR